MHRDQERLSRIWRQALLTAALLVVPHPNPSSADQASRLSAEEGIAIGGSVSNSTITNIVNKQDPAVLASMAKTFADQIAASAEARAQAEARAADLAVKLGFTSSAVAEFFKILGEKNVSDEKIPALLIEIAIHFTQTQKEIQQFRGSDNEVQALRQAAASALQGAPNYDLARAKLEEARQRIQSKREAVAKVFADQQREEAALVLEQAQVEAARLRFAEAAGLYEQAAGLFPADDHDRRGAALVYAGLTWTDQGSYLDDSPALESAITAYRAALLERTRERVPLAWAATQNSLGIALQILGERESGSTRLEEALMAYRAALQERKSALDLWAESQNNLGNVLEKLGERENGTTRLEEAVAVYQEALKAYQNALISTRVESTRERFSLAWAGTQNNLGNVLERLGERESGTTRFEEAVMAYRAALQVQSRERVPLDWAMTQNNLSIAFEWLAERSQKPTYLTEALACMRGAAEVYREKGVSYRLPIAEKSIARMEAGLAQMGDKH